MFAKFDNLARFIMTVVGSISVTREDPSVRLSYGDSGVNISGTNSVFRRILADDEDLFAYMYKALSFIVSLARHTQYYVESSSGQFQNRI